MNSSLLSMLRLSQQGVPPEDEEEDPTNEALQRYIEHLQGMPQRQEPGFLGKLIPGLIGGVEGLMGGGVASGVKLVDYLKNAPYERAVGDWQNKGRGLATAAELENRDYLNELRADRDSSRREIDLLRLQELRDKREAIGLSKEEERELRERQLGESERHNREMERIGLTNATRPRGGAGRKKTKTPQQDRLIRQDAAKRALAELENDPAWSNVIPKSQRAAALRAKSASEGLNEDEQEELDELLSKYEGMFRQLRIKNQQLTDKYYAEEVKKYGYEE